MNTKEKSINRIDILTGFMSIRILMGATTLALCFNGHYNYTNAKLNPSFAEQNVN